MIIMIIMETLFVFLNVQLKISLRIGNLQMLLEIWLFNKTKQKKKKRKENKRNQNCIKLRLGYPNSYFYNKRRSMLL